jgi:hypothetical protein
VEEAYAVIARLDRIEAMELAQEPALFLLNELELLALETKRWLEREGPATAVARVALERCLLALESASRSSRCLRRPGGVTVTGEENSVVCPCVE